jgi:hypothetical protein
MQKKVIPMPPPLPPQTFFFKPPQGVLLVLIPKVTLGSPEVRKKQVVSLKPHLLQDMSLPHLVSLFPATPILALLVGKGLIAQAPSSSSNSSTNNNTNNKRNPINLKPRKIYRFQH